MRDPTKKTAKRPRTTIKRDAILASDYLKYEMRNACEDCTHFRHSDEVCTLGYNTQWHRKAFQTEEYLRTGKIAFCRFLEID